MTEGFCRLVKPVTDCNIDRGLSLLSVRKARIQRFAAERYGAADSGTFLVVMSQFAGIFRITRKKDGQFRTGPRWCSKRGPGTPAWRLEKHNHLGGFQDEKHSPLSIPACYWRGCVRASERRECCHDLRMQTEFARNPSDCLCHHSLHPIRDEDFLEYRRPSRDLRDNPAQRELRDYPDSPGHKDRPDLQGPRARSQGT